MNMWQPIETAPKDRFLLLCGPSGYTTTPRVFGTGCMYSDYHVGRWVDHANDDLSDWGFEPTHWMPLPEAPDAQAQRAPSIKDAIIDDLQSQFDSEGITEHDSGDALIRLSDAIAAVEDNFAGAQPAPSVPMDVIADYLVSISAHLARRDDAKAQAEIGELLKMIASAPKPGASVPEDVMRDAERYRYLRARDDGTAGVGCWIEADGRVCDRGWLYGVQLDSAIDSFIEVLAAAPKPEAKP